MAVGMFEDGEDHLQIAKDCRLMTRAIKQRWMASSDEACQILRAKAEAMAIDTEDVRAFTRLLDTIVKMEGQNQKDELVERGFVDGYGGVNVNVGVVAGGETGGGIVSETVHGLIKGDPAYIEFLRSRAAEADSNPGPLRAVGERGPLENGETFGLPGSGAD